MGMLYYGDRSEPIEFPDALLAHLKVVIITKLRRRESFTFGWRHSVNDEGGRSALWVQESIPLRFVFDAAEGEKLDPEILQDFSTRASSGGGLNIDLQTWMTDHPLASTPELVAVA